jgi:hypothetical protein
MSAMYPPEMPPGPVGPEMALPPEPGAAPGLPVPPGGPGIPPPPMDAMSDVPLPAEGGIEGLLAALGGGGGGLEGMGLPGGAPPEEALAPEEEMSATDHIRQAIKHMMLAMVANDDEEQSAQITKGLGPLQNILGGEQKREKLAGG